MRNRVLELLRTDAYRKGQYTLSSGKQSEHYVNCKPVTLNGEGLHLISQMLLECIEPSTKAIAGLTLGADPLVAGVALASYQNATAPDLEGIIVRKKSKGYGTNAWLEGNLPPKDSKIVILEDVVTSGNSSIQAALRIRDAGYTVERVVTIVDRQEGNEAYNNMESANLDLISLFLLEELCE